MYFFIVFGPPNITLNCLADYAMLKKVAEVSWKPTLLTLETNLSSEVIRHIENCDAAIKCKGGHREVVSVVQACYYFTKKT